MQKVILAKQAAEDAYAAFKAGTGSQQQLDAAESRLYAVTGEPVPPKSQGLSTFAAILGLTSFAQTTSYYCGPATAMDILWYLGPHRSYAFDTTTGAYDWIVGTPATDQHILANAFWLATDQYGGTNWGNAYMPFTLNSWRASAWYVGANSSGLTSVSAWQKIDADMNVAHPVAENVLYGPSTYSPPGFTSGITYLHWDVIHGDNTSFQVKIAQPWPQGTGYGNDYYEPWGIQFPAIAANHGIVY
jgi:hypothetical protein